MAAEGFEGTTGMLFLSTIFTMGLWGAGTVQLYYYYDTFKNDHLLFKFYVFTVWLFDTTHQIILIADQYITFVKNFGDYERLLLPSRLAPWVAFCGAFVSIMVQAVFIWRIWRLSKRNKFLLIIILLMATAQFVLQLIYFGLNLHSTNSNMQDLINLSRGVNSSTVVTDCLIAGSLVWLLRNSRTGFQRSDTVINHLIIFVITTGLATAASAVLTLIMTLAYPDNFYYVFFFLNITRLYVNSLLAMLNYRKTLSGSLQGSNDASGGSFPMSPFRVRQVDLSANSFLAKQSGMIGPQAVNISVVTETMNDEMEKVRENGGTSANNSVVDVSAPPKSRKVIVR